MMDLLSYATIFLFLPVWAYFCWVELAPAEAPMRTRLEPATRLLASHTRLAFAAALTFSIFLLTKYLPFSFAVDIVAIPIVGLVLAMGPLLYLLVARSFKAFRQGDRFGRTWAFLQLWFASSLALVWLVFVASSVFKMFWFGFTPFSQSLPWQFVGVFFDLMRLAIALAVAIPLSEWLLRFRGRPGLVLSVILGVVFVISVWNNSTEVRRIATYFASAPCTVEGAIKSLESNDWDVQIQWKEKCYDQLGEEGRREITDALVERGYLTLDNPSGYPRNTDQ